MQAIILGRADQVPPENLNIPLFLDRVPAGFPSPASDYCEGSLDLNELCITKPAATYFVRASGDSMIDAGIFPGDVLVVDRSLDARHGDVVIAEYGGELTVKRLELKPTVRLMPMNKNYLPLVIPEGEELQIFGVVTTVIHSLRKPWFNVNKMIQATLNIGGC